MWLLSTDSAELHWFAGPESVASEGGYAILSHVWVGGEEQTLQEVKALVAQCQPGQSPRDLVSSKIKECCQLAERHGFKWVWIDTCCIDKTSSSELSEAINSMFRYYSLAEVCYAFLYDVPTNCALYEGDSAFRNSKWHRRGWTLQELIAPALVLFLSAEWEAIGTKMDLAKLLSHITGVEDVVLRLECPVEAIHVAKRMAWAADRRTTRVEDEAYCLMGIFGINMPTLYGEGRLAFRRLQEEIMKNSIDSSLFAWGPCKSDARLTDTQPSELAVVQETTIDAHCPESFIFAPAPSAFRKCGATYYISDVEKQREYLRNRKKSSEASQADIELFRGLNLTGVTGIPTFTMTAYGVHAHIPVIDALGLKIAVLFCFRHGEQLGLLLHKCRSTPDPNRPLYHTCYSFGSLPDPSGAISSLDAYRLIPVGGTLDNLVLDGRRVTATWQHIFLAYRNQSPPLFVSINRSLESPFRVPQSLVMKLRTTYGFELWDSSGRYPLQNTSVWAGHPARLVDFIHDESGEAFQVWLGYCDAATSSRLSRSHASRGRGHWAVAYPVTSTTPARPPPEHVCSSDHVSLWRDGTKTFGDIEGKVQLSFSTCRMSGDGRTQVLDIVLDGCIYLDLKAELDGTRVQTRPPIGRPSSIPSTSEPPRPGAVTSSSSSSTKATRRQGVY
ncbi:heterokaryon incompatibility protein-domain-containing protein [Trametes elegans]|nr:heterokaryon incompatibility protein-domain-containing protein [Trametes elegans]